MYNFKTYLNASLMIDLFNLSKCSLNDFEAFEQYLFTEEEKALPDLDRFDKFVVGKTWYDGFNIAIPFENPDTMVEHQINHYVMWSTMAYLKAVDKPENFYSYNYGEKIDDPLNSCFACEYTANQAHLDYSDCEHCPIWKYEERGFMCERNTTSLYRLFCDIIRAYNEEDKALIKSYCLGLAISPWSVL